jgi:DNA mismatch endonuclease (patch repair protein)
MVDVHSKAVRSKNMAAIKPYDTKPEWIVRRIVHRMGFRYRLHAKRLPGRPDMVLPKHRKIIMVNGCYWHRHRCKYGRVIPKTNAAFWENKRNENVKRDRKNKRKLERAGWKVLTVWECWTRSPSTLEKRIRKFLAGPS